MTEQEIDIRIDPDGTVHIDMLNYKGSACEADIKKLIASLGVVTASSRKQEYYHTEETHINQTE